MGLMSFIKEAGEKLFGREAKAAETGGSAPDVGAANAAAAEAIAKYVATQNLTADNLKIEFDGANGIVTVSGTAPDQATKEKILLCCGNVSGVDQVDDNLAVAVAAEPPARFHTVVSGDNLSKIAKAFYGNPNEYPKIFEANKPMLKHPDKIYPGQVLRIPA